MKDFFQFWHNAPLESAFLDELRKLLLGVLTSLSSCVWWVPQDIYLLHLSVLALLHLADMPQCSLLLFSALDLLSREFLNIGCHHLGQQLEETLLLCRLIKLFGVLGSEKRFRPDSAAGLVQIEMCCSGLHLGTLLLHCTLFWLFRVCEGLWRDDAANTIVACFGFHWVLFDQLSERILRWHPCQWFPDRAFLASRISVGVVPGTWAAPLQSRSCSENSILPLAAEVHFRIFHRWIGSFVPTSWLLVVRLLSDLRHCTLRRRTWYPTTYSTGLTICHLQLMLLWLQELLLASLVGVHLWPNQSLISVPMVQFCLPISWTQKGDDSRNDLVQESLEPRLDCSSDLEVPQMWEAVFQLSQLHNLVNQFQLFVFVELHCCQRSRLLMADTAIDNISVFTSCDPWIPATDRDVFRPWSLSFDTSNLSTNEIEDLKSHIASTFRLKSPWLMLLLLPL